MNMGTSSKIISLKWNNHDNMVKQSFGKFLRSSVLADCTISAEGQHLKAHKIVLAACSHYFESLFSQDNMNNPVVILKDVKFYNVNALLHFMYHGEVMVLQDHLNEFVDTAKSLQVRGLENEYKEYGARKILKRSKLDNNSVTHISATSVAQFKINNLDVNDIDETSLTVGISKLSMNSDNHFQYQIQNTATTTTQSLSTLTSFKLNNVKFRQTGIPGIKIGMQYESQSLKPTNKKTVQPRNPEEFVNPTLLDNKIEDAKKISEVQIQQTSQSSESALSFGKRHSHKSVQVSPPPKTQKRSVSPTVVTTEIKDSDSSTSVNVINNKSSSLSMSQPENTCQRSCCIKASQKPDELKTHKMEHKRRHRKNFCENCKETFSSTFSLRKHHCVTHQNQPYYFTFRECGKVKWPVNSGVQHHVHRSSQPLSCQYCHTMFRNIRQLQYHLHEHRSQQYVHRNSMPFTCRYCPRLFMNVKHLQYHFNEHRRRWFLYQEWAKEHRQNHVPFHAHVPIFVCLICRKVFTQKVHLREHQNFHIRK